MENSDETKIDNRGGRRENSGRSLLFGDGVEVTRKQIRLPENIWQELRNRYPENKNLSLILHTFITDNL